MCLAQRGPTRAMAATKPGAARRQTTEKLNSPSRWLRTQKRARPSLEMKTSTEMSQPTLAHTREMLEVLCQGFNRKHFPGQLREK